MNTICLEEKRQRSREFMKKQWAKKSFREKMSKRMKENNPMMDKETKSKMIASKSIVMKKLWKDISYAKKVSLAVKKSKDSRTKEQIDSFKDKMKVAAKKNWQKDSYRSTILRRRDKSSYEIRLQALVEEYDLEFRFVGDGSFWLKTQDRRFNPDFIHNKLKIAIEVFEDFHKEVGFGSVENYITERKELYNSQEWNVVFISKRDLFDINWKEKCLEKIKSLTKEESLR